MQLPPAFCHSSQALRLQRATGHVGNVLDLWTVEHYRKEEGLVAKGGCNLTQHSSALCAQHPP